MRKVGTVTHAAQEGCPREQHPGARWSPLPMLTVGAVALCESGQAGKG